jgi:RNA polymerase sigma-70 factor (ECF subfamily)
MSDHPLEKLLQKLERGDPSATEEVFVAYEPYLRMVVRRQLSAGLRAKFDSVDIVQSVWVDVLDGFRQARWNFGNAAQLKAFLVKAARNRFIDRLRQHRRELEHEQDMNLRRIDALPAARDTRPSEAVHVDELWGQILDACPENHYELLRLKRQGLPLAEIAARTGLHESSVRRIIYEVERRFGRNEAAHDAGSR